MLCVKSGTESKSNERGFSLVEVAIVLAIVGLVIAGVWTAASSVSQNRREAKASEQLLQLVQNIRTLYAGQSTIGTANITDNLRTAGAFPSDMISGADELTPWGNAVVVTGATTAFTVSFASLPAKACVSLASANIANRDAIGLTAVSIGGTNQTPLSDLTPATAATDCASGATVVWTFGLRG